jgi:ABC-2 type transport system ATP-binding protein
MVAEPTTEPLAELINVHKHFGQIHALRGIDLQIEAGEILALLGPNGAGKTTAISILLGRRRPDRGQVTLLGCDPRTPQTRRRIGATPQETGFPNTLKVREVVDLVRAHYEHPRSTQELLTQVGLVDLKERQTGGLSGGEKRRLAVALAFAGDPVVVFLDEPTTGLDLESRHNLWQAIRDYRGNGGTVLLTTHYLEEAEQLATRASVIARGQIVAQGSVDEIRARTQIRCVRLKAASLPELPGIARIEHADGVYTLYTPDPDELVRTLIARQVSFRNLEILQTSLEQAFLDLTREET